MELAGKLSLPTGKSSALPVYTFRILSELDKHGMMLINRFKGDCFGTDQIIAHLSVDQHPLDTVALVGAPLHGCVCVIVPKQQKRPSA